MVGSLGNKGLTSTTHLYFVALCVEYISRACMVKNNA
jgi:hypothetical protein